jgi:hypothetical protein
MLVASYMALYSSAFSCIWPWLAKLWSMGTQPMSCRKYMTHASLQNMLQAISLLAIWSDTSNPYEHCQLYDKRKTNEMHFFQVVHIFKISTRSYMFQCLRCAIFREPKVILPKLCVCYVISWICEGREWILSGAVSRRFRGWDGTPEVP